MITENTTGASSCISWINKLYILFLFLPFFFHFSTIYVGYLVVVAFFFFFIHTTKNTSVSHSYRIEKKKEKEKDTNLNSSLELYLVTEYDFSFSLSGDKVKHSQCVCGRKEVTEVQFSSIAQSCLTLCNPMDHSMPGLPVYHQLPELKNSFHQEELSCYEGSCNLRSGNVHVADEGYILSL